MNEQRKPGQIIPGERASQRRESGSFRLVAFSWTLQVVQW